MHGDLRNENREKLAGPPPGSVNVEEPTGWAVSSRLVRTSIAPAPLPGTQVRAIRSYVWDIILTIRSIEYFYIGFRSRRLPMRDQCAGTFGPCPNCYYERCGHLGAGALRRR